MRVVTPDGYPSPSTLTSDLANQNFVINGRPFNGTGFGLKPTPPAADADVPWRTRMPMATITPCCPTPGSFNPTARTTFFGGIGGADEDYDIWDMQNMILARVPVSVTNTVPSQIMPSLHRPDLIAWWKTQTNWSPQVARQTMLRPMRTVTVQGNPSGITTYDHPEFHRQQSERGELRCRQRPLGRRQRRRRDHRQRVDRRGPAGADGARRSAIQGAGRAVGDRPRRPFQRQRPWQRGAGGPELWQLASIDAAQRRARTQRWPITPTAAQCRPSGTGGLIRGAGYGPADISLAIPSFSSQAEQNHQHFYSGVPGSQTYEGRYGNFGQSPPLSGRHGDHQQRRQAGPDQAV